MRCCSACAPIRAAKHVPRRDREYSTQTDRLRVGTYTKTRPGFNNLAKPCESKIGTDESHAAHASEMRKMMPKGIMTGPEVRTDKMREAGGMMHDDRNSSATHMAIALPA